MVCAWALVLDQVTAEVEGALSSALESDDAQALIDACDLAKTYGLESTAARFEEAKERVAAGVERALSSALESDDGQALIDACDLAKAFGLESTAATFEEAKERVEQKSREVGDDDHAC